MQHTFDSKSFSKAVKFKRVMEENMGLRETADIIGVSHSTLSRIENQKFLPNIDNMFAVCNWLGKSICDFIKTKK